MAKVETTTASAAMGAVLGALVGDAAGATLEFLGHVPSDAEVRRALAMPGGGTWHVAPGQITDDGELTLCLLGALQGADTFPHDRIAAAYLRWYESPPFDIGFTTAQGVGAPHRRGMTPESEGLAAVMSSAALHFNTESKANGSLMRSTPLAVWGHNLSDDELAEIAALDSSLTHPNESCCHAVAAYIIAIASLVRGEGRDAAVARAASWVERAANDEVRAWLDEARRGNAVPFHPQDGFVRIAFTHAFRLLVTGVDYESAIAEVLAGGGDTDTNACIVGGLLGAAVGVEGIPGAMRTAVLTCDTDRGRPRPAFLRPAKLEEQIANVLRAAR